MENIIHRWFWKTLFGPVRFVYRSDAGFSLISLLISFSVIAICITSLTSLMVSQEKGGQNLRQQMAISTITASLVKSIMDSKTCSCNFNFTQNMSMTANELSIQTSGVSEIQMDALRTSCDFDSSENILIEKGAEVKGGEGLVVKEIKVSNIYPTGSDDLYLGELMVIYALRNSAKFLSAPPLQIAFFVDPESGPPGAKPIKSCWENVDVEEIDSDDVLACSKLNEEDGLTLVGCGGTNDTTRVGGTAFGYQSGLFTGGESTYMGYQSGHRHSGTRSTFFGYRAGKSSLGSDNTAIGWKAGLLANESDQIFLGYNAGVQTRGGAVNSFIGAGAGGENGEGSSNVFVGFRSGRNNTSGSDNVFIGDESGLSNTTGSQNVIIGRRSWYNGASTGNIFVGYDEASNTGTLTGNVIMGEWINSTQRSGIGGADNISIGSHSGSKNKGSFNVFLGYLAGYDNADQSRNMLVGAYAGRNNQSGSENTVLGAMAAKYYVSGEKNTFLGYGVMSSFNQGSFNTVIGSMAGALHSRGNQNILIGYKSGNAPYGGYSYSSNVFVVTNRDVVRDWLFGDMTETGNLYINNQEVLVNSSESLKRNIKEVKDFDRHLKYLLETPLFTYHYKSKEDYPEKERMGIISEELPEHLQIKKKGSLSHPDWPSIYGSFWAGIKALAQRLKRHKERISGEAMSLGESFRKWKQRQKDILEDFIYAKRQLSKIKANLDQASMELRKVRERLARISRKLSVTTVGSSPSWRKIPRNRSDRESVALIEGLEKMGGVE